MNTKNAQSGFVGVVRSWARLLKVARIAVPAILSVWGAPAVSACEVSAQRPMEAVFTGAFENGAPVYRFPSITVSAKRDVDVARRGAEPQRERRARRDAPVVTVGAGRSPS